MLNKVKIILCFCGVALALGGCPSLSEKTVEWASYGSDPESTKFSEASLINKDNFSKLRILWEYNYPDNESAALGADYLRSTYELAAEGKFKMGPNEGTPIMVNEKLYTITSMGTVVALKPDTGKLIWSYDTELLKTFTDGAVSYPPNIGYVHRGVSYWESKSKDKKILVFGTLNGHVVGLNADTGKKIWSVDAYKTLRKPALQKNYAVNSPPAICGDVVVYGSSMRDLTEVDYASIGDVRAINVRTGQPIWTFKTVPDETDAEAAKTWLNDSWKEAGNTNVWTWMSVDRETSTVFLPTGTPNRDFYGGKRLGDNLYAESLVALDCKTGQKKWHQQLVHHGLWDYDLPAPPIVAGETLYQVSKQGFMYAFNKRTGEPVGSVLKEKAVPESLVQGEQASPTQPFVVGIDPYEPQGVNIDTADADNDLLSLTPGLKKWSTESVIAAGSPIGGELFTPPSFEGTMIRPGFRGGASWAGASYNKLTDQVFVPSISYPHILTLEEKNGNIVRSLSGPSLDYFTINPEPFYGRLSSYKAGKMNWIIPMGIGPVDEISSLIQEHDGFSKEKANSVVGEFIEKSLSSKNVSSKANSWLGYPRRTFVISTPKLTLASQFGATQLVGAHYDLGFKEVTTVFYNIVDDNPELNAIDPKTGEILSTIKLPNSASGGFITYVYKGRQYIAMPVGGSNIPARLIVLGLNK